MKFDLPFTFAQISKVNPRAEFHGDEKAFAMDLKVSIEATPDILDQFCDEDLKPNFSDSMHDEKKMLFNSGLSELVFGCTFEEHKLGLSNSGVFTQEEVEYFPNVKVKSVRVIPKNHGLIEMSFTVQLHPIEKDIAFLNMAILKPCYITLIAPEIKQEKLDL